jgi:hypothetical protein
MKTAYVVFSKTDDEKCWTADSVFSTSEKAEEYCDKGWKEWKDWKSVLEYSIKEVYFDREYGE